MEDDRGSFAVHNSLEDIFEEAAMEEDGGGASGFGDNAVLRPPGRGGSDGGVIEVEDVVLESRVASILPV